MIAARARCSVHGCVALRRLGVPDRRPLRTLPRRAMGGFCWCCRLTTARGQPNLEWIREAAPEILSSRFASAGFAPMSRADRLYALDHLGLPQGFHPSRASALKLAQTLDADSIVVGSFLTDGTGIVAEAQVVDVPHLRMSQTGVGARGDEGPDRGLRHPGVAIDAGRWTRSSLWRKRRLWPPAAGCGVDAFEQYIRGISEPDHEERLRHLNQAVQLSPNLGRHGWRWGARITAASSTRRPRRRLPRRVEPANAESRDALEAGFYRGLSLLFSGDYPKAEQAFAGVARVLPLAEVVNNEGVAVSRQGHDGTALFRPGGGGRPECGGLPLQPGGEPEAAWRRTRERWRNWRIA